MMRKDKVAQTRKLYSEHSFGTFDYDRARYYKEALVTRAARQCKRGDHLYDVGCGEGFLIGFLGNQLKSRVQITGIDLSPAAVRICRKKGFDARVMSNLSLQLPNNVSDFTISNGVIHHTPDARKCFHELVRITKPGKRLYVSVYKRHFYYHYLYTICSPIRWLYRKAPKLVFATIFPLFHVLYFIPMFLVLERKIIGIKTSKTLFADQILTPIATFHTGKELCRWATEEGCTVNQVEVERKGQMISIVATKRKLR